MEFSTIIRAETRRKQNTDPELENTGTGRQSTKETLTLYNGKSDKRKPSSPGKPFSIFYFPASKSPPMLYEHVLWRVIKIETSINFFIVCLHELELFYF